MKRTPSARALTVLVQDLLRLNSLILRTGDRLVAPLGLTSARWQVLGAIIGAERPQPVAWIARDLDAARQNVQRIVNDLHADALVVFAPNPHHRRAQLVVLTEKGRQAFASVMEVQVPWANHLSEHVGLTVQEVETAHHVVQALRKSLEDDLVSDEQD